MSTVRTGYSFGWTLGPVLGSLVAGWAGYRLAFALTAALFLFALIPPSRGCACDVRSGTMRANAERNQRDRGRCLA